jgi:clusterin-associated protein 1
MSYRECRSLCEMLRALNYSRIVSLENFAKPNFELVADILYWLAQKYDPQTDISDDINEEKDRVEFMRTIVNLFAVKARIKLNPKKLYQADTDAVTEILKIASLLYKVNLPRSRPPIRKPLKRKKLRPLPFPPRSPTSRLTNSKPTKSVT